MWLCNAQLAVPRVCHVRQAGQTRLKLRSFVAVLCQTGGESVVFQELWMNVDTLCRKKNPSLFILSIDIWSASVEGSGYSQMTSELENKAFSAKATKKNNNNNVHL